MRPAERAAVPAGAATVDADGASSQPEGLVRSQGMRWVVVDAVLALAAAGMAVVLLPDWRGPLAAAWAVAVVVVVRSDLDRFIIPDAASAAIAILGLCDVALGAAPDGGSAVLASVAEAVAGGMSAFALFWGMSWLYRRRSGEDGLGFGDVKLAGASAVWLSLLQQTVALEIACVAALALALPMRRGAPTLRGLAVPFGAFLAPAAWLVFVAGPAVEGLIERWT